MTTRGLTDRQRQILQWMVVYFRSNYRMPVMRDIASAFGWTSRHAAHDHLTRIAEKGYLQRIRDKGSSAPWVFTAKCKKEFGIDYIGPAAEAYQAMEHSFHLRHLCSAAEEACNTCRNLYAGRQQETPCSKCIWRHVVRRVREV